MSERVVLGVDLGTTATKVVAATADGTLRALAERGYPLDTGSHGEATQDPELVAAAAAEALAECARVCAGTGDEVVGISFSAAMHTLLALDRDGRPMTPALSWADHRAAGIARDLRSDPEWARELHRISGTPVHPMSPLVKLAWFAEHEPDTHRAAAHWLGVKDYVVYRLTGRLVMDHSCGSGTGLMDIHDLRWSEPALKLAGITESVLPELVPPTETLILRSGAGLPSGIPVVVGAGDGPLANLGAGAVRPGMAAVSLGTSGALRVIRDAPGIDDRGRAFCYALADGLWVLGGAVSNGGVVGAWAADSFGMPVADLLTEAEQADTDGLLALPYLLGERAPWWDPDPRAALIGVRREHGRAEITRAMVEGVAQQLALVLDAVLDTGVEVTHVRATGGAFRSALWGRVTSAALGRPLELTEGEGGSGLGAVLLGWRALGELPSLAAAADLIHPARTIDPEPDQVRRLARHRPLVERAYHALRDVFTDLT